jgi:hypothetical protein
MVQAGNGHEGTAAPARHHLVDGVEYTADHIGGGLVDTRECRSIPQVEIACARGRLADHPINIGGGVKALDTVTVSHDRRA